MTSLAPFDVLLDVSPGRDLPLPPRLAALYGHLGFPLQAGRPYLIGNFVTTLDGVATLTTGASAGGPISGFNEHDRMLMGLLRAAAGAVVVGAGTLRSVPDHFWTAEHIYPALAGEYRGLRAALGYPEHPLNVIVTASGRIDAGFRVLESGEVPVLIVTTARGAEELARQTLAPSVRVVPASEDGPIAAAAILKAIGRARPSDLVLLEGGPRLMGDFFAEGLLDQLFLTLAPQVAGRTDSTERPGFVSGKTFAPEHPVWGNLLSVRRAESHLFLRYSFPAVG